LIGQSDTLQFTYKLQSNGRGKSASSYKPQAIHLSAATQAESPKVKAESNTNTAVSCKL